ncbi:hypothetical protein [Polaromonas sp.]|uniref:hypothetical protein n=1 Tax=Polaromonas sp. TaxID=1869339 RepID=UPI0013BA4A45|nr:hypothetical protein [Polaromonas sp.]NDP62792.1 hypothetical protein [Polaromonas sp.]
MPTVEVPANGLFFLRLFKPMAWTCLAASACLNAAAQDKTGGNLPTVTISAKANPDPVEKSYRKMIRGMDLFEQERGLHSPDASLRFKLLPRRPDTDMQRIEMEVVGTTVDFVVPIAPDQTFTLARSQQAYDENAQVSPNRRAQSMTWRSEIKTPGLPPYTRRLGDLRMECRVGMEAGLISNRSNIVGRMVKALLDTPAYCDRQAPLYLFFADRPLFSVTLVAGQRREILPIDMLYAAASDDPKLKDELPYCDCEVLVDRTYVLPLGDRSWPDDTRVEFEYMEDE